MSTRRIPGGRSALKSVSHSRGYKIGISAQLYRIWLRDKIIFDLALCEVVNMRDNSN